MNTVWSLVSEKIDSKQQFRALLEVLRNLDTVGLSLAKHNDGITMKRARLDFTARQLGTLSRKDMDKNWNSGKLKQGTLCFRPRGKLSITAVKSVADKELSKIESLLSGTNKVTDPKKRKNKSSFTVPAKRKDRKDETEDNTLHEEHVTNNGLSMYCQLRDVSMMSSDEKKVLEGQLENVSEVALTLVYSDGSSQLRGSEVTSGKRKQSAADNEKVFGIALTWLSVGSDLQLQKYADSSKSEHTLVLFPLEGQNSELQKWQGDTLCRLLRSSVKKVCYEAQNMIRVFLNHFSADFSQVIKNFVIHDPKVAAWLLDPDHTPASFSQTLDWHTTLNQSESQSNLSEHLDSDLILLLFCMQQLENRLVERELLELYLNVELPLCPLLAVMETRAMKVDTKTHQHFSDILKMKLKKLEAEACKTVGFQFSLNSHVQLRQVLFEKLQLDLKLPKGSKGIDRTSVSREKSTSEAVLSRLQGTHPLPDIILQHRQLQKLKSTYIDGITAYITDGQLRTHWDQISAATGRLTSTNPNVQSMPKQPTIISGFKDSFIVGKENDDREDIFARDVFISKEGFSFLAADFQQIELRLLAHLSGDARLIQLFSSQDSADVFTKLTAQWLNKPLYKVKSVDREQTKRIVYSVMYGVGKEKLADYLKTSSEAAAAVMNSFLVSFPVINLFTKKCVEECQQKAYLTTIFKRRRLFPNIKHSSAQLRAQAIRQAVNFRVQGSAADLCKAAMIQVERKLVEQPHINASLLLQIHDELLLEVKDSQIPEVADLLKAVMEDADTLCGGMAKLKVPIQVSLSIGKTWGHLQPYPVKYHGDT